MSWTENLKNLDAPFLSHHPLCSSFKHDLIRIGRWKLCLGCAISYPILIGILVGSFWYSYGEWEWYELATWGIPLGLIQLTSTLGLTKWRPLKIAVKVILGVGMGFTTLAILKLPYPLPIRTLIFIFCAQLASVPAALRSRNIKKKCEKCPYQARWDCCPGYINTRYNTGAVHELPILPHGEEAVSYKNSEGKTLELPVPLR